jgi:hypothetical protein
LYRDIIWYKKAHNASVRSFCVMAAAQRSHLFHFAVSRAPCLIIQCIAVNIRFLLTTFTEAAGNNFLLHAEKRHTLKKIVVNCTSNFCWWNCKHSTLNALFHIVFSANSDTML